jgi:hypothetical protein
MQARMEKLWDRMNGLAHEFGGGNSLRRRYDVWQLF